MANINTTNLPSDKEDDIISQLQHENATLKEIHETRLKELNSPIQLQGNGFRSQFRRLVARKRSSSVLKLENQTLREENAKLRTENANLAPENIRLQMDLRMEAAKVTIYEAQVAGLRVHITNQRRGEEYRTQETEHTIRVLQSDIRELAQLRDEELEGLRKLVDTMRLPPPYITLNPNITAPREQKDSSTADATSTLSTAVLSLRRAKATGDEPTHIIHAFHESVRVITLGVSSRVWPVTSASSVLETVLNNTTRLGVYLRGITLQPHNQHVIRAALAAADTLVFEILLLLFASGGRRAELSGAVGLMGLTVGGTADGSEGGAVGVEMGVVTREHDSRDDEAELRLWKQRIWDVRQVFESMGLGWRVFADSARWVGDTIFSGTVLAA